MSVASLLSSIESKLAQAQSLLSPESVKAAESTLVQHNFELRKRVEAMKLLVRETEMNLGITQCDLPAASSKSTAQRQVSAPVEPPKAVKQAEPVKAAAPAQSVAPPQQQQQAKPPASDKKSGQKPAAKAAPAAESTVVDVGRLDMRVGMIMEVSRHPDADSLYVEKVDLGEGHLRTVVSGLVNFVPIEKMENRVGIFMCNLKPAKMRGVESQAMLMCASSPEAVEPLIVETKSITLGQQVVVSGFTTAPDVQLNPKKKIFEQVKPDLRVDADGFAAYKGVRWTLKDDPTAIIKSDSLKDVQIA